MKFQCIVSTDENEPDLTFASVAAPVPEGSRVAYVIDALTWEDAMAEHHRRQGFEPYKPEGELAPCPRCDTPYYPEGSGMCGKCGAIEVTPLSDAGVEAIVAQARMDLARRFEFDKYQHKTLIALCEEVLRLRAAK